MLFNGAERREGGYDADGFEADADDLADEAEDVAWVVGAVGVGGVFDLVLVDDPFEGGAGAEAVIEGLGRDAGEGDGRVDLEGLAVGGELHLEDALGVGDAGVLDFFERPGVEGFVMDVEAGELLAGGGERAEVGGEGDAGELTLEIGGVAGAVLGVVEQGVDVVEGVCGGDGGVGVVGAELGEGGGLEVKLTATARGSRVGLWT